ncbi:hypothetical protein ACX40Y_09590 [Sphingomonas sp. RS6]
MNYDALNDYIRALRTRRDQCWTTDEGERAARYERYADAIDFPMRHVRYGTKLTQQEVEGYYRDLIRISAPSEIEALVPLGRSNAVYAAVMKLARSMERILAGKPARKRLGLF